MPKHGFFQDMLTIMGGNFWRCQELYEELRNRYKAMDSWEDKAAGLESLFALVSYARKNPISKSAPFLFVRVQLWMRELRRLLGRVAGDKIDYALATDLLL